MKKKVRVIGIILMFAAGLSILLYPSVSDRWNKYRDHKLIATYQETISMISDTDYSACLAKAREYNKKLIGSKVPDAFSIHEGVRDFEYEQLLNVTNDGVMGYIEIPSIDVKLPIYHYTNDETLQKGAGHLPGSSLPIGGESTHAVISAHRGLPSAKMFTDLNLLENGDVFYVHVLGDTLAYQIDQILTVEPKQTDALGIVKGKDYVTLVTCTPYGVNSKRLLVRGTRIPYEEEAAAQAANPKATEKHNTFDYMSLLCVVIGIAFGSSIVLVIVRIRRRVK